MTLRTVTEAYELIRPQLLAVPLVFSSPHSGRDYPEHFLARSVLDARVIRSSEDAYVDELFAAAPAHGAPLLLARVPRAYLDLNRAAVDRALARERESRRSGPIAEALLKAGSPADASVLYSQALAADPDVMDTWATSSLSPQIAGGWEHGRTALVLAAWVIIGVVVCVRTFRWRRADG